MCALRIAAPASPSLAGPCILKISSTKKQNYRGGDLLLETVVLAAVIAMY